MSSNCDVEASDKSALQSSLGFNRAFIGNRTTVNANGRAAGASNLLPHDGHHEVLVQLELLTELRHFPELRKEGIVAVNQKEQLTEVLRNIRRALLLPASAYLHLSYDGLIKGTTICHMCDLKTFLVWCRCELSKDVQFVPVIAVKCDAELMPEVKPLLSKSAKRRQRQKLKEETSISVDIPPSSEESSPCIPTSAPCGPASTSEVQRAKKRVRKDLEHSDSLPAVFSASYMHKKWTVLKDSILQVSEQLYRLNANFEIDRNTGLRVLTRMNMAQIYDLAMCEVGMARAIGDQHVEEEIRATCATFQLEEGDDRDALSAVLYDRYIIRAMRRYFVYFNDDKYLERESSLSLVSEGRRMVQQHSDAHHRVD